MYLNISSSRIEKVYDVWMSCSILYICSHRPEHPILEKLIFNHSFPRSLELYDRKQCFRGHLWRKNKSFHKKPTFLSCPKKPNWVPLNGAVGWDLRAQWDILSKYYDILTKYLTVLSTLSRQHHSAGTQFGFFGQLKHGFFLKRFVFPPQMTSEALFSVI